jgi:formate dehydrogenase major subunit
VDSDLIIVINTDPTVDYPIVAHKIRKALNRGAKLAVISAQATRLDGKADVTIRTNPRKTLKLLQGMQAYLIRYDLAREGLHLSLTEEEVKHLLLELPETVRVKPSKVIELLHLYLRACNPVVVVDGGKLGSAELTALHEIVRATGNMRPGRGILQLFEGGNCRGQLDMGVHPDLLPGRIPLDHVPTRESYNRITGMPLPPTAGMALPQMVAAAKNGDIVGMVILGDNYSLEADIFDEGIFTVVITSNWRTDLNRADVVLPAATFAETSGTVTNSEGRLQKVTPAFSPPGGKDNLTILSELAKELGVDLGTTSPEVNLLEMQKISGSCLNLAGKFFINQEREAMGKQSLTEK